jgi:hypothetical protein
MYISNTPTVDEAENALDESVVRIPRFMHEEAHTTRNIHFYDENVAEPPKLYAPHVPTIVFQTSNSCTCKPETPVACRVSSEKPESSMFYNSYRINKGVVTTLQYLI